jgi:uncharacterized membrane protein YqjE
MLCTVIDTTYRLMVVMMGVVVRGCDALCQWHTYVSLYADVMKHTA